MFINRQILMGAWMISKLSVILASNQAGKQKCGR
jgi:hypothetical protein